MLTNIKNVLSRALILLSKIIFVPAFHCLPSGYGLTLLGRTECGSTSVGPGISDSRTGSGSRRRRWRELGTASRLQIGSKMAGGWLLSP